MQAPLQTQNNSDAVQTTTANTAKQEQGLVDNRQTPLAQRKLAEMMNNSPHVLQQRALSDVIHNSSHMAAQRHEMDLLFGGAGRRRGNGEISTALSPSQRKASPSNIGLPHQSKSGAEPRSLEHRTHMMAGVAAPSMQRPSGLPYQLKTGIESLSGISMDHVNVHYNSDKPAQLQAHAYTQGSDIHVGPGQEKYLAHEAWHVVQQAQGRVRSTSKMAHGMAINDDIGLETEADSMGARASALQLNAYPDFPATHQSKSNSAPLQLKTKIHHHHGKVNFGKEVDQVVGLKVEADLDPFDGIKGTTPNLDASPALYKEVALFNPQNYARGHLLNHDLGGQGECWNLYPISKGANARHSFLVERYVKQQLHELKKDGNTNGSRRIRYVVTVLGKPEKSQFHCTWGLNDNGTVTGLREEIIESDLSEQGGFIKGRAGPVTLGWQHTKNSAMKEEYENVETSADFIADTNLKTRTDTTEKIKAAGGVFSDREISEQEQEKVELIKLLTQVRDMAYASFQKNITERPQLKDKTLLLNTYETKWYEKLGKINDQTDMVKLTKYREEIPKECPI